MQGELPMTATPGLTVLQQEVGPGNLFRVPVGSIREISGHFGNRHFDQLQLPSDTNSPCHVCGAADFEKFATWDVPLIQTVLNRDYNQGVL